MSIRIRQARSSDAAAITEIYRPYVLETPITFEDVPPTVEDMAARVAHTLTHFPYLVAEVDGHIAGYAYASAHHPRSAYRWSVDVSVYLDRAYHRRGLGTMLYRALFALLRLQGYVTAYACITIPNAPSIGLHESLGFTLVGRFPHVGYKHGQWHEVGWWAYQLPTAIPSHPSEPIPWPVLQQSLEGHTIPEIDSLDAVVEIGKRRNT